MKIFKLLLMIFSIAAYANTGSDYQKSVQWQKLNLEKFLKNRVDGFVHLMVDKEKVYSEINVKVKDAPFNVPNFTFPKTKGKQVDTSSLSEKKNFGEYLLFDKIGLRAPIIANNGVEKVEEIELDDKERNQFNHSVEAVKKLWDAATNIDPDLK